MPDEQTAPSTLDERAPNALDEGRHTADQKKGGGKSAAWSYRS